MAECDDDLAVCGVVFFSHGRGQSVFDWRTPKTNLIVAAGLILGFGTVFLIHRYVSENLVTAVLSFLPFLFVPAAARVFKPLDVVANAKNGRKTVEDAVPEEDDRSGFLPEPKSKLARLNRYAVYDAPEWQRLGIQAFWTFALAVGAIMLSRSTDMGLASIWWANAYLAYILLLYPRSQWFKPLLTFYVAVVVANLVCGNALIPSSMLAGVNTLEGTLLAAVFAAAHDLRFNGRRVTGGGLGKSLFAGDHLAQAITWAGASAVGAAPMITLMGGKLIKDHLGYKDLDTFFGGKPVVLVAYVIGIFGFYAYLPVFVSQSVGNLFFILASLPLVGLGSLFTSGVVLSVTSLIYFVHSIQQLDEPQQALGVIGTIIVVNFLVGIAILARYRSSRLRDAQQRALEFAPNAILTFDQAGRLKTISKNAMEWFGALPTALVGRSLPDLFDNKLDILDHVATISGEQTNGHFVASGETRIFEISVYRNEDASLPYRYVASMRDITTETRLDQEKDDVAQIVHAFMTGGPQYYTLEDSAYRIVAMSEATAKDFVGLPVEECIGRDWLDLGKEDGDVIRNRRWQEDKELHTKKQITSEYSVRPLDPRELRHLRGHITLIPRKTGDYFRSIVTEDITELKHKEQQLELALKSSQAFLAAGTTAFTVQDEDFNYIFASEEFLKRLGCKTQDLNRMDYLLTIFPEWTEDYVLKRRVDVAKLQVGETQKLMGIEKMLHKDGSVRFIQRSRRWFRNPNGAGKLL